MMHPGVNMHPQIVMPAPRHDLNNTFYHLQQYQGPSPIFDLEKTAAESYNDQEEVSQSPAHATTES